MSPLHRGGPTSRQTSSVMPAAAFVRPARAKAAAEGGGSGGAQLAEVVVATSALANSQNMTTQDIAARLKQLEAEMRSESAMRDDHLAKEREELSLDGVDHMRDDAGALRDGSETQPDKMKQLELAMKSNRRSIAKTQAELEEAKVQRRVQQQLGKFTKQHKFLDQVTGMLTSTTQKEIEEKRKWEDEWDHRLDLFRRQHLELQQALEKKQMDEMRFMQLECRRKLKKLDDDTALLIKKGNAPSPRALQKVQDENVEQTVLMFQRHTEERAHLSEKVAAQEDILMKSRSQSLEDLFLKEGQKSENLSRRFMPKKGAPTIKAPHMIITSSDHDRLRDDAERGMTTRPPEVTIREKPSRKNLHSSRSAGRRLPSPQLEVSGKGGEMMFSTNFFMDPEDSGEEDVHRESFSGTLPTTTVSRGSVRFAGEDSRGGGGYGGQLQTAHSRQIGDRSINTEGSTSFVPSVVHHSQSFGDQAAHRQQSTIENPFSHHSRRPIYPGAHGQLHRNNDDSFVPLPVPGTEQTGWTPIDTKSKVDKHGRAVRGTNDGTLRPAFVTHVVTPQYKDSSAKAAKGATIHLGAGNRFGGRQQKASGAAYKVPIDKLGMKLGRTLPLVRAKSKEEKEEMRRQVGHSLLDSNQQTDPVLHPKSPNWGAVSAGRGSPMKSNSFPAQPRSASVDPDPHQMSLVGPQEAEGQDWATLTNTIKEEKPVSEKFSQLETWVEQKIRAIMGEQGHAGKPGSAQGSARRLASSQGARQMHTTSATPQQLNRIPSAASSARPGSKGGLPGLDRIPSASSQKGDGTIAKLLTKLKTTMASNEEFEEPTDKRKGRPPALTVGKNVGMIVENPRVREKEFEKDKELQTGKEVQQVYDDFEVKGADRGEPWALSSKAKANRDNLEKVDTNNTHIAYTPKTPKRVGFTDDHMGGTFDAFRPETGYSQQTVAQDRPETGVTSYGDVYSRPVSTRPQTEDTEFTQTTVEDEDMSAVMDPEEMKKDFFAHVRHNKVQEVEDTIAAGFPIDTRDEHGNTALMVSCQNGHKRLAKLCMKYGANPDTTNHQGNTSLHYAVSYGYQALAKYLISHGGDDTIMNHQGQTPYEMGKK